MLTNFTLVIPNQSRSQTVVVKSTYTHIHTEVAKSCNKPCMVGVYMSVDGCVQVLQRKVLAAGAEHAREHLALCVQLREQVLVVL